jgi:hypothetical protein
LHVASALILLLTCSSWQLRFLVKAFKLFCSHDFKANSAVETISRARSEIIQDQLHLLLRSLILHFSRDGGTACLRPPSKFRENKDHHQHQECPQTDVSNGYYVMLTIYYVLTNCKSALDHNHGSLRTLLAAELPLMIFNFPSDEQYIGKDNMIKTHILRWYHHESVLHVNGHLNGPPHRRRSGGRAIKLDDSESFIKPEDLPLPIEWLSEKDVEERQTWISRWRAASYRSLTARISAREPYTAEDEECDRLIILARELKWEEAEFCINQSERRVSNRTRTTTLNPGVLTTYWDGSFPISRASPWELHVLCHHIRLFSCLHAGEGQDKRDRDKVEEYRKRCLLFLTSEGLLLETWERSNAAALQGWFTLEASCVVASSLLDDIRLLCNDYDKKGHKKLPDSGQQPNFPAETSDLGPENDRLPIGRTGSTFSVSSGGDTFDSDTYLQGTEDVQKAMLSRLSDLLEAFRQANKSFRPFNWKGYQPPVLYHDSAFFNSLDDSPQLFGQSETKRVQLRDNLKRYLNDHDAVSMSIPAWSIDDLEDRFPVDDIGFLSVVDIKNDRGSVSNVLNSNCNPVITGRIYPEKELWNKTQAIVSTTAQRPQEIFDVIKADPDLGSYNEARAWRMFTQFRDRPVFEKNFLHRLTPEMMRFYAKLSPSDLEILENMRELTWSKLRTQLLGVLRDSVRWHSTLNRSTATY